MKIIWQVRSDKFEESTYNVIKNTKNKKLSVKTTGITTMYMDIGMDTGDMILKEEVDIFVIRLGGEKNFII